MKEVGYFNYDDNKYHIMKSNESFLIGKETGKIITFKLTHQDKEVIKAVIDGLTCEGNLVKLLPMKLNNNVYDTYYNVIKDMYIFPDASGIDLLILNNLWNHQEIYEATNIKKKIKGTYQRIIKIGKKVIIVFLAGTLSLGLSSTLKSDIYQELANIPDEEIVEEVIAEDNNIEEIEILDELPIETVEVTQPIKEEIQVPDDIDILDELPVEIPEETKNLNQDEPVYMEELEIQEDFIEPIEPVEDKFTVDYLIELINSNPNLSSEEKDLFLSNHQFFIDNINYFSKEEVTNNLKNLNTSYHSGSNENEIISGTYTPGTNTLDFYNTQDFSHTRSDVVTHEFSHAWQEHEFPMASWLREGLNATVNEEYFDECSYLYQQNIVRALKEIIGSESLKNCNFKEGDQVIKDALYEVIPDLDLIESFFAYNSVLYDNIFNSVLSNEDIKYFETEINYILSRYYEAKYNRSIDEDLIMTYLLDKDKFKDIFCESHSLSLSEEIFNYVVETHYTGAIFKSSNSTVSITLPNEVNVEKVDYKTLLEAAEEGIVTMHEDGTYTILPTMYKQDENGMFYRQEVEMSKEKTTIVIDDTTRYIDSSRSR